MRKIRRRANEENCVAVNKARDARNVNGIFRGGTGYQVNFDVEVKAGFAESGMCGIR